MVVVYQLMSQQGVQCSSSIADNQVRCLTEQVRVSRDQCTGILSICTLTALKMDSCKMEEFEIWNKKFILILKEIVIEKRKIAVR